MEAERNKLRSESAAAGRTIAKQSAQLAAAPKARTAGRHVLQHGPHCGPLQDAVEASKQAYVDCFRHVSSGRPAGPELLLGRTRQ